MINFRSQDIVFHKILFFYDIFSKLPKAKGFFVVFFRINSGFMQIESIRHLRRKVFFFVLVFINIEEKRKTTDGNCPVGLYAGLDLLPFETSFRRVLVNMIILQGILRISVLLFTHSVFLKNELHIAFAHQLIVEMHCAKI